ncbi:MAG: hypothetical protein M1837_006549 [Sclerophora amabilis]|nr:MAG: hypothetical protein M1837_006549 [Sclerophora amabilis]
MISQRTTTTPASQQDAVGSNMQLRIKAFSQAVSKLGFRLSCSEAFQKRYPSDELESIDPPGFEDHTSWLATMIVRGCEVDIDLVLETIETSGFFGPRDEDMFRLYVDSHGERRFTRNPDELAGDSIKLSVFGFWLPHSIHNASNHEDLATGVRPHFDRFNRTEAAYTAYFNLPNQELLLEADQEEYYEKHTP